MNKVREQKQNSLLSIFQTGVTYCRSGIRSDSCFC